MAFIKQKNAPQFSPALHKWTRALFNAWTCEDDCFEWTAMIRGEDHSGALGVFLISKYREDIPNNDLCGRQVKKFFRFPDKPFNEWYWLSLEEAIDLGVGFSEVAGNDSEDDAPKETYICPSCGALYWADCICDEEDDDYWYDDEY